MASQLYPQFKEDLLKGVHDMDLDTISCVLISTSDEATITTSDTVLGDIAGGPYGSSTKEDIGNTSITDGVFNGDDIEFTSVAADTGKNVNVLILYNDTQTDKLIAWIDGFGNVLPNGGNITVTWDTNIFSL